jgi:hypothetical protein
MHLVAYTRRGLSDVTIERAAREQGVIVRAMSRLYVEAPPRSALMLGFSGYPRQTIAARRRVPRRGEDRLRNPFIEITRSSKKDVGPTAQLNLAGTIEVPAPADV